MCVCSPLLYLTIFSSRLWSSNSQIVKFVSYICWILSQFSCSKPGNSQTLTKICSIPMNTSSPYPHFLQEIEFNIHISSTYENYSSSIGHDYKKTIDYTAVYKCRAYRYYVFSFSFFFWKLPRKPVAATFRVRVTCSLCNSSQTT